MYELGILSLCVAWLATGLLLYLEVKDHKKTRTLLNNSCAKIDEMAIDGHHKDRNYKFQIDSLEAELKKLHVHADDLRASIERKKVLINDLSHTVAGHALAYLSKNKKTKKGKKNVRHA